MFISLFTFNQEFDRGATEEEWGRHLDDDGNNGAVECDACIDDVTDEDFICWITEKKGKKEEEFTLTMTDKDWIRELCEWADATRTRDLPFLMLLQKLVLIGKVKIEDVTLSLSSVAHSQINQDIANCSVSSEGIDR